jgi:HKD family nuclease
VRDLLGRGGQVRLLAGDYLGITEPNALLRLLDLQQGTTGTFDVRLFESQGRSLHPKAYMTFELEDVEALGHRSWGAAFDIFSFGSCLTRRRL